MPAERIPGGIAAGSVVEKPIQGIAYREHRYHDPKPPFHWKHEYLFTRYTLDCALRSGKKAGKADILRLAEGHIFQKEELKGYYQRKHK